MGELHHNIAFDVCWHFAICIPKDLEIEEEVVVVVLEVDQEEEEIVAEEVPLEVVSVEEVAVEALEVIEEVAAVEVVLVAEEEVVTEVPLVAEEVVKEDLSGEEVLQEDAVLVAEEVAEVVLEAWEVEKRHWSFLMNVLEGYSSWKERRTHCVRRISFLEIQSTERRGCLSMTKEERLSTEYGILSDQNLPREFLEDLKTSGSNLELKSCISELLLELQYLMSLTSLVLKAQSMLLSFLIDQEETSWVSHRKGATLSRS